MAGRFIMWIDFPLKDFKQWRIKLEEDVWEGKNRITLGEIILDIGLGWNHIICLQDSKKKSNAWTKKEMDIEFGHA